MKVIWEVEDGYIGRSRPHEVEIDDDELSECETDEERQDLIEVYVQDDFDNKISWAIISQKN